MGICNIVNRLCGSKVLGGLGPVSALLWYSCKGSYDLAVSKRLNFENRDLPPETDDGDWLDPQNAGLSFHSIMQTPKDEYEYVSLPTYSANRRITRVLRLLPDSPFRPGQVRATRSLVRKEAGI